MEIDKKLQEAINLQQQGNSNEAIKVYEEILKKKPNLAEVQNNLGILLKSLNRLNEAEKIFTKTILLKPDFVYAHYQEKPWVMMLLRLYICLLTTWRYKIF